VISGCSSPPNLSLGTHGCLRSACCIDGEVSGSTAFPLHPPINTKHEARQTAITFFHVFGTTRPGIEPSLLDLVARSQPAVPQRQSKRLADANQCFPFIDGRRGLSVVAQETPSKNANSTPQFCFISDQFRSVPSLYPKSLRPLLIAIEKVSGSGCTNALYNRQAVLTCQTLLRQEKPLCVF